MLMLCSVVDVVFWLIEISTCFEKVDFCSSGGRKSHFLPYEPTGMDNFVGSLEIELPPN